MLKPILIAWLICSCAHVKPTFPTNTTNDRRCKQEYADGKLSWDEYQDCLKSVKRPIPTPHAQYHHELNWLGLTPPGLWPTWPVEEKLPV